MEQWRNTVVLYCLWGTQTTVKNRTKATGGIALNKYNTVTIDVTETGGIASTAPYGQVRCLNGPWLAIYSADGGVTFVKSPYTNRAAVTVANPDSDGTGGAVVIGCS